jgi:hypothetical protein
VIHSARADVLLLAVSDGLIDLALHPLRKKSVQPA